MKIIIVDDDPDVTFFLKSGLEEKGIFVDTVVNVEQAQKAIGKKQYDIAIVDLNLSPDSGLDVAKFFPITRIIFITGYPDEKKKLIESGYTNIKILDKPVSIDRLLTSIFIALDEYTNQFCNQIFSNVCEQIKCLDQSIQVLEKNNDRTEQGIYNLNTIYSGLSASYKFIYESIDKLENKLNNRDKVFHDMNEITMTQIGEIRSKIDKALQNGK
jgi:DNA-binding response OmpR family regulator